MNDMEWAADSPLDAMAAQARSYPPLPTDEVARLLDTMHRTGGNAAAATLVRHHLSIALDAALERHDQGVEVGDLFQEGSIAVFTAVDEYARRGGDPAGLRAYVERVVVLHLDAALAREAEERAAGEAFVRDAQRYEIAEVEMRQRLAREPSSVEIAAALEWPVEKVEGVAEMLAEARALNDEALLPYLDDGSDDTDDEED
ncbi:MAG TPA: sigma-70 domain-containing protein [Candidatus Dormibacteraeota bacterium]|jgi:RNA polymerase primary sigma factor|nr:sigma-70 domain-containing protein [Candidatus Dormibacteraeota bacterium]